MSVQPGTMTGSSWRLISRMSLESRRVSRIVSAARATASCSPPARPVMRPPTEMESPADCPTRSPRYSRGRAGETEVRRSRWAVFLAITLLVCVPACKKRAPDGSLMPEEAKTKKAAKPPRDKYAKYSTQEIFDLAMKKMERKSYSKARELLQKVLGRQDTTPEL